MPSLPDIALGKGQILLTETQSTLGISSSGIPGDPPVTFGAVQAVYETSDKFSVGDTVMFDIAKIRRIVYGSTIYFIITEDDIAGKENPIP